jgi:hypothetical protein
MLTPLEVYAVVLAWLQALGVASHATAQASLAALVSALLVGQSLRSAALMRALPSPGAVPARPRYQRVARAWTRPWLSSVELTPRLIRAAVALVPPDPAPWPTGGLTHLALDTVRCGGWDVLVLGVVWHGRVLPLAWAVLPYPWPKGQFTPTVCALLTRVAAAWPAERPVHLVADRAFPSHQVFRTLDRLGWGYTLRLRAHLPVTVGGQAQTVRDCWQLAPPDRWTAWPGTYGHGRGAVSGTVVVGRGWRLVPAHQAGPGSQRQRAAQAARREHDLATKRGRRGGRRQAPASDRWLVLFTTHRDWHAAATSYRRRWTIEGSYRDAQSGWDGQHGWALEETVGRCGPQEGARVDRLVGLWALGALVQTTLGDQVGQPTAPPTVRACEREWTTTGRLSVWARGQFALQEPSGRLRAWVQATLAETAARLAAAPPLPSRAAGAEPPRPLAQVA